MSKCIYRNDKFGYSVELPALPEYDETEYPYAYIMALSLNVPQYYLALMPRDARLNTPDDASVTYNVSHYLQYDCRGIDDVWDGPDYCTGGNIYVAKPFLEFPENGFYTLWSNFDIYNDMGLYCPASDPIPVEEKKTFCLRSWLTGFALGLAGKPLPLIPVSKREPIGFFYGYEANEYQTPTHTFNGVDYIGAVLPDIETVYTPELQKEYPYAVMERSESIDTGYEGSSLARLLISNNPIWYCPYSFGDYKRGSYLLGDTLEFGFVYHEVYWGWTFTESKPYPPANEWAKTSEEFHTDERLREPPHGSMEFIWTNHAVVREDGYTPYKEASEPIPVYE